MSAALAFHSLMVQSELQETAAVPSRVRLTPRTAAVCPSILRRARCAARSHSLQAATKHSSSLRGCTLLEVKG